MRERKLRFCCCCLAGIVLWDLMKGRRFAIKFGLGKGMLISFSGILDLIFLHYTLLMLMDEKAFIVCDRSWTSYSKPSTSAKTIGIKKRDVRSRYSANANKDPKLSIGVIYLLGFCVATAEYLSRNYCQMKSNSSSMASTTR